MIRKRNEQLAKTVIKGLQSRNMSGYYAEDKEAALKQALELIPEGSTIAMGGCMSAGEIGLISALEAGNYHYIDRSKMDARTGLMAAYDADIFLSSANAITSDGVMVNEACAKCGCTYQCPEIRHQDSLQRNREMLRL